MTRRSHGPTKANQYKDSRDLFCESNDAFAGVHDFEHHTLTVVNNIIVHIGKQRKYTSENKIDEKNK